MSSVVRHLDDLSAESQMPFKQEWCDHCMTELNEDNVGIPSGPFGLLVCETCIANYNTTAERRLYKYLVWYARRSKPNKNINILLNDVINIKPTEVTMIDNELVVPDETIDYMVDKIQRGMCLPIEIQDFIARMIEYEKMLYEINNEKRFKIKEKLDIISEIFNRSKDNGIDEEVVKMNNDFISGLV